MSDTYERRARLFRVRFREIRSYATDVLAANTEEAIATAQRLRHDFGTDEFEQITERTADWEAEADDPAEDVLSHLRKALTALNAAERFQAGDNDSYVIAAELARTIHKLETGGAE